jgi:hypothetical protein
MTKGQKLCCYENTQLNPQTLKTPLTTVTPRHQVAGKRQWPLPTKDSYQTAKGPGSQQILTIIHIRYGNMTA